MNDSSLKHTIELNEIHNQHLRDKLFHAGHKFSQEKAKLRNFETLMNDNLSDIKDCMELLLEEAKLSNYQGEQSKEDRETLVRIGLKRIEHIKKDLTKII